MPHPVHRIVVCLDGSPQGDALISGAAALARRLDAELIGLRGLHRPRPSPPETFARGTAPMHEVLAHQAAQEQTLVQAAREAFATLVRPFGVRAELHPVWDDDPQAAARASEGDLVVVGRPRLPALPDTLTADRLLLSAGRSVLIVPGQWDGNIGRHVLVGWNGSLAARQAIDRARPLFATDAAVTVLVVDEAASPESASELADQFAINGVRATVKRVNSLGRGVASAMAEAANEVSADLVVAGGYSRSPTVERWFGGVTRALLAKGAHPLLLSHLPETAGGATGRPAPD